MKDFSHYIEDSLITPLYILDEIKSNKIFIKRDDLIPYSFGGNKVRKALLFFEEIDKGNYDCVVTYGSSHSNHCRIVANMAAERNMRCYIIAPLEVADTTYNSRFVELCQGEYVYVPVEQVHQTIENVIEKLKRNNKKPYFIQGGGHGNLGTQAYVKCYNEIYEYEKEHKIQFDYIFFASGTGTTQAGLVSGKVIKNGKEKIIGISIARKNPYGVNVILQSIKEYLQNIEKQELLNKIEENVTFLDKYIGEGYGKYNEEIENLIKKVYIKYGIPLDSTYTGKAFYGMQKYILENEIVNSNVLFIHTGGTPLFFDDIIGG